MATTNTSVTTSWVLAVSGATYNIASVTVRSGSGSASTGASPPAAAFLGHPLTQGKTYNFTLDATENLYIRGVSRTIRMILTV